MKKLLAFIFLIAGVVCQAQTETISRPMPVFFIDSIRMDSVNNFVKYIKPDSVTKVYVDKSSKFPNGVVYITLKDHHQLLELINDKQLSLQYIAHANLTRKQRSKTIIYVLDGDIVADTSRLRIPAKQLLNIKITDAADIPYFKKALPNVVLLKIISVKAQMRIKGID